MAGKKPNYINFKFQLIITNLKNFIYCRAKTKGIKFKIINTKIEMLSHKKP